jgi:hypothetical protein
VALVQQYYCCVSARADVDGRQEENEGLIGRGSTRGGQNPGPHSGSALSALRGVACGRLVEAEAVEEVRSGLRSGPGSGPVEWCLSA